MSDVALQGAWSTAGTPTWAGSATSAVPSVAAVVIHQPHLVCWAKSKPGDEHSLQLLLHPLTRDGTRVQPLFYVGTGILGQPIQCILEPGAGPPSMASPLAVAAAAV